MAGLLFFLPPTESPHADHQEEIDLTRLTIDSAILDEERTLWLVLPQDHERSGRRYPVLYQLDGGAQRVQEAGRTVRTLSSAGTIPEMIIVGIENTDRWRDMLPVELADHPGAGGAERFLDFLTEEAVRLVDEKYPTNRVRLLSGRSNSALFTLFALTEDLGVFDAFLACSPSVGHCRDFILDRMAAFLNHPSGPDRFLFISNGGRDGATRLVGPIPDLIHQMNEVDPPHLHSRYRFYEEEGHCPTPTLADGLVWAFQQMQPGRPDSFGHLPPGPTPQRFHPGLISTEGYSETGGTFTPDGTEFYFTRSGGDLSSPTIFLSRRVDGAWTAPEPTQLSGFFGPHVSPDGTTLFASRYGLDEDGGRIVELWSARRGSGGWTDWRYHGLGSRPSMSRDASLYSMDRSNPADRGVIVAQDFVDGDYSLPRAMGGGIDTPFYDAHPCIAADGGFLIFDSTRPGGFGGSDLYVSFRGQDGTWGDAVNLGPSVNSAGQEGYASISPDGDFLLFSSDREGTFDLYRVDLGFLENPGR